MNEMYSSQNTFRGRGAWRARFVSLYILLLRRVRKQMVMPVVVFAVMTVILAFSLVACRQILRWSADDPQVQMAKDAAYILGKGASTSAVTSAGRVVDVEQSLASFIMVYDDNERIIQGSGKMGDSYPVPPHGVFNYVKNHGENRVTLEPKKGLRIAAVVIRVQGNFSGYVLAGRSLAEVEKRMAAISWEFFAAWLLGTLAIFGGYWFRSRLRD